MQTSQRQLTLNRLPWPAGVRPRPGLRLLWAILSILWLTAACAAPGIAPATPAATPTAPIPVETPAPPVEMLRLGAVLPLSGPLAPLGQALRAGYEIGAAGINETGGVQVGDSRYQVAVRYADETDPAAAARLVESWLDQGEVDFVLSPFAAEAVQAVLPLLAERNLPLVDVNDATGALYPAATGVDVWLFGVQQPVNPPLAAYFDAIRELGADDLRSAGIGFMATEPTMTEVLALARYADAIGFTLEGFTTSPTGETDVTPLYKLGGPPDLIVSRAPPRALPGLVQAVEEAGLAPRLWAFDQPAAIVQEILGDQADQALLLRQWGADLDIAGDRVFRSAAEYARYFQARFQNSPRPLSAAATASLLALQAALEQAASLEGQAVREALADLDIATFFGQITFAAPPGSRPTGRNAGLTRVVAQLQDGKLTPIWPPSVAQGQLRAPAAGQTEPASQRPGQPRTPSS